MTKIREIHELLQNIQSGVSEKSKEQEKTLEDYTKTHNEKHPSYHQLKESLEHTKGQLYEVTYILDNFWEIISK